jgi:hypothetical protein
MFNEVPASSRIKVGRITFIVLSALPIAMAVHLLLDHPANKSEGLESMILGFLMMFLSLILGVIGAAIVIRKALKRESVLFWLCSTIAVALPGLYVGGIYLWFSLTVR